MTYLRKFLEERNLTLKERIREIKQEIEETVENKNQEMASLNKCFT